MHVLYDVWIGDVKRGQLEFHTADIQAHSLLSPRQPEIERLVADTGRILSQRIAQLFPSEPVAGEPERLRHLSDL